MVERILNNSEIALAVKCILGFVEAIISDFNHPFGFYYLPKPWCVAKGTMCGHKVEPVFT